MDNTTWIQDQAASLASLSGGTLTVLAAVVLALSLGLLFRPAKPLLKAYRPRNEKAQETETTTTTTTATTTAGDGSEIQSLDGFDWTTARRNVFRPFKPIYHITMGACPLPSPPSLFPCCLSSVARCPMLSRLPHFATGRAALGRSACTGDPRYLPGTTGPGLSVAYLSSVTLCLAARLVVTARLETRVRARSWLRVCGDGGRCR